MDDSKTFSDFLSHVKSKDKIDWQQVRIQAAIAAMQGILGDYEYVQEINCASPDVKSMRASMAKLSVLYADALVKELKGEQP